MRITKENSTFKTDFAYPLITPVFDIIKCIIKCIVKIHFLLEMIIETVPKKMRFTNKDGNSKKSTILIQIA